MPSLRDFRDRISSVKSTKKITSAMKMVAAAKLKKAQDAAEAATPYAHAMAEMMRRVADGITLTENSPKLLIGSGADQTYLLVVVTSDRGLCGGFNGNLLRFVKAEIKHLEDEGKTVKILTVGRKGYDILKTEHSGKILKNLVLPGGSERISFADVNEIAQFVLAEFERDNFDVCLLLHNEFKNILTQTPSSHQLVPFSVVEEQKNEEEETEADASSGSPYSFEPNEEEILAELLPKNVSMQLYRSLLENAAGEQAARMTAMDNATRNAGDLIKDLTLQYNRARQAYITKELIEIISGAEAV